MPELAAQLRAEMDAWQSETKAPIPTVLNPEYDLAAKTSKPVRRAGRKKEK
jgi:hypothetical protein